MNRIGLLGGSFDPVHCAHLALAQVAQETLDLKQVQLIPAGEPWQKPPLHVHATHRLNMLELATKNLEKIVINPIEINRKGPSYTVETLEQLATGSEYFWILGSDQLSNFCSWHRWQEILSFVQLAVAQRPGSDLSVPQTLLNALSHQNQTLLVIPFDPQDVSATAIRQKLAHQQSTRHLLPAVVEQYIYENGLYHSRPA